MADAGVGVAVVHVGDDKHLDEQLGCIPSEEGAELRIVLWALFYLFLLLPLQLQMFSADTEIFSAEHVHPVSDL